MKIQASFVQDGKWWVAWTDDVPGALTQGVTLEEARENLIDAVRMNASQWIYRSFPTIR